MDSVPEPLQDVLAPVIRVLIILAFLPLNISSVVAHWDLEFLNVDLGLMQGMLDGLKFLRAAFRSALDSVIILRLVRALAEYSNCVY